MKISVRLLRSVKSNGGLDFSNTREAYRSKTFGELLRHYLVYKVFAYKLVVESSQRVRQPFIIPPSVDTPLCTSAH